MHEQSRHAPARRRRRGDLLVRAGAAVFAVGVLGVLVMVGAFYLQRQPPLALDVVATLTPVGLALALVGLLRGARSEG